jgi:hypothetical protein
MAENLTAIGRNEKQAGKCPFCEKTVKAEIVEENMLRRDKCKCPECEETIYLCRSPGCHDYAKGTSVYDHEFCPECTSVASAIGAEVGSATLKVVGAIASAVILAAISGKKK